MLEKFLNNRLFVLYIIPFLIGLLSVFSFQPYNFSVINFFILPIIFYLIVYINKKSKSTFRKKPYRKNLFTFGCLFGFGFYLSGISWITNSLTFDKNFEILIPFALILIPLFLSFFIGLAILLIGPFLNYNISSIFIFSAALGCSDYLRAKILTGFPWNLWAYSVSESIEMLQILNIIGLYAYNLVVITVYTLPAFLFFRITLIKKIFFLSSALIFISSIYIFGSYEINKNKNSINLSNEKINVKIISPNFDLKYGLTINEIKNKLEKLIKYSDPQDKKTLFVWPEGAFSGYSYDEVKQFKDIIKKNFNENQYIIFGINKLNKKSGLFYNSLLLVNNEFEVIQQYNKQKLVPFGEFLPFESLLNSFGLKKITEGHGSFQKGIKKSSIKFDNLNILPLICYEVIFTSFIQQANEATNLIVNISEDAWFGDTIGPNQHYVKSIFRAIENGTFLVRSANKGISAIIDNKGVVIKQLNINEAGNIELDVPLINSKKNKNDLIFIILLITYLIIFYLYKKKYDK